ncbi:MAG: N-acetylmuramoyl-L-alanine amidase [Succinatimonas sp.]|nr:N-acetylmuramoyl-L-alanine amidase [Succinatimonas sp.]
MSLCWLNVEAAALKSVRAFANQDKTRVVFDLSGEIRWAQARQKDGRLIVRLKDLSNYKTVPSMPKPASGCLAGASSVLDGRDVRYILQSQRCGTPKVFMLTPRDGNRDHRLVVDFPHAGGNNVQTASSSSAAASSGGKSLKQLESELFAKYSSVGSDGLRSMSPKQAREYDAALAKLRQDYAKKNSVQTRTKSTFVTNTEERETEEVKDTVAPPKAVEVKAVARPFIIAIDPGHGGKDPGAKGKRGVREKDVTLAIAKSLAGYINTDKRLRAVLTRSSDRYVDLDTRSIIARNKKAALLISIHCNSTPSATSARGTEVLLLSSNRAQRENSKVTRTGSSGKLIGGAGKVLSNSKGNPYLEEMVVDMSSQNSRAEGYDLAAEILKSIGSFTKVHKKKPVYASLAVLKAPDIPSLLIETGFLSNRYEEIQLNQPNYQKQMAYRIFLGIRSYYEKNPLNDLKSRIDSDSRGKNNAVASTTTHTVQKGEYLSKIAARYNVSVAELRRLNSLKSDTVHAGQILKVPKK